MANRSHLPVYPMSRDNTRMKNILGWAFCLCLMPFGTVVTAEPEAAIEALKPYTATYKTKARGMSITLDRELKSSGNGGYTLTNGAKIMVAGFHEVSTFDVEASQIIPKSYVYQGTGLINRRREVHFTPDSDVIRSLYKKTWYELPYQKGTLDRMSQQEQMRLTLINDSSPKHDVEIRVADGKRVKDYKLAFIGEETLQTDLGPAQTLHFERLHSDPERKSHIWLVPAWDYLMVRTTHLEDGSETEVLLTSATIDGEPIGT